MARRSQYPRPALRDWAVLGVSLIFTIGGLLMTPTKRDQGIVTVAFFGACALVALLVIVRKLRFRRQMALKVEIVGGVPIRPSRFVVLLWGSGLAALGTVLAVFGGSHGPVFQGLGLFIAAVGGAGLLCLAVGWLPAGFLQFDPGGLTVGARRWAYTVSWDNVARIAPAEFERNPMLLIWLRDPQAIRVVPPDAAPRTAKHFAANQRWFGAPVVILTSHFGLALPLLAQAIERYVHEPASRAELARRHLSETG